MKDRKKTVSEYSGEKYLQAFLLGFGIFVICMLPFVIIEKGFFIYYGDYNAQQIPFYNLLNDAIRGGNFGWNWFTDLGSDLMTSYSFYLIGSPFFWLTVLMPRNFVVYSMPLILAIKHGVACLTSYAYIRRFVKSKNCCLVGAMLYSFSGFQVFNIFFNHFQDVTALFPLMLIAMEENIMNRRKGWFALTVGLMACVNYYFFAGQAVFLVLYYLVRITAPDFRTSWKKFFGLFFEAVIGTAIAAFILLPSALDVVGNYRVSRHLYGIDMLSYKDATTIWRVLETFFVPVDIPARPNLFQSDYGKWASIGGYMPLFSMLGVITFFRTRKKHWAVKMSLVCILFAFIPVLNSLFQMANSYYYARWFYMPILIFAMMTAQAIDDKDADFKPAVIINFAVLFFFGLVSLFPTGDDDNVKWLDMARDNWYFAATMGISFLCLVVAAWLLYKKRKRKSYSVLSVLFTAGACVVCVMTTLVYGAVTPADAREYIKDAIDCKDEVYEEVSEDNFFRMDISENCDNYSMIWGVPNMRAFQSTVNPSIMNFYSEIGVERSVASRAERSHYSLRGLFSVKYYYAEKDNQSIAPPKANISTLREYYKENDYGDVYSISEDMPGFEYVGDSSEFYVYENKLYIPMGFTYDDYISMETSEELKEEQREKMLMDAVVLDDEQIQKYGDMLKEIDKDNLPQLSENSYEKFCKERQQSCSDSFSFDSRSFTCDINLDRENLVFFSVPYSKGWTAEVNGEPVDVEKVSYGFMAVKAGAGENKIVFRYTTPGIKVGTAISLSAVFVFIMYLIICHMNGKKSEDYRISHTYNYNSCTGVTASQIYCDKFRNKKNQENKKNKENKEKGSNEDAPRREDNQQ